MEMMTMHHMAIRCGAPIAKDSSTRLKSADRSDGVSEMTPILIRRFGSQIFVSLRDDTRATNGRT
jgi:hypothetical protein